ncbi:MAG: bifunctional 4-hydroxy-3-methylbut-2-enyl diphosphate reductase/30S ribosomal protein S1 [Ruminococcus sp.]|jgi:4-hydroxy-3-methylbut-2-enyl diphosphate reductase|nr:bifunctional 4-hydroxy-3-methylbut-2-enyl diphosphate reductase/30S ribosomal protein S1 [Ruminococcus sp.]
MNNYKITVSEHAGFCFGVERAVRLVYDSIIAGKNVFTLGEIIHNNTVTDDLNARGVKIIKAADIDDLPPDSFVIIRSHGIPKETEQKLTEKGINYRDGTCPFVKHIHKIVADYSQNGYDVFLFGDRLHDEVIGISSFCENSLKICSDLDDFLNNFNEIERNREKKLAFVAQTTYNIIDWEKCTEWIRKNLPEAEIFNTVCSATTERQAAAIKLAAKSDVMIAVGSEKSSNSRKLGLLCQSQCQNTFFIENALGLKRFSSQLKDIFFKHAEIQTNGVPLKIGITAGASVPCKIIEEVKITMSEILQNNIEDDESFEALLNATSTRKVYKGGRVKGIVTGVHNNEVTVDIGTKHTGYVDYDEFFDDVPAESDEEPVKVGNEFDFVVVQVNDSDGTVTLSKRRADAKTGMDKLIKAKDEDETLDGVVNSVVKGGVIVMSKGARVFIPASQSGVRQGGKLEDLIKKSVKFKLIEVSEEKNKAVGSIRAASSADRDGKREKFWETVAIGKKYTGEVRSITNYGAFVDLGGIDGMVHLSELSWSRITHPSQIVKVGDTLEVYIKELDREKNRVSLGYKDPDSDPYVKFAAEYKVGQDVPVKIVSITPFGAFAQIVPGVDGLVHISQISDKRVTNVGEFLKKDDIADARITEIDLDKKRISLSIKAILEDTGADEAAEEAAEVVEAAVEVAEAAEAVEAAAEVAEAAEAVEAATEVTETPAE